MSLRTGFGYSKRGNKMAKVNVNRRKAYQDTSVSINKSREEIDKILMKWGVVGIQWEDHFDSGVAQLRFRWKRDDGSVLTARFRVALASEEDLRKAAIDKRSGKFSQKKYDREKAVRGKREHRLLLNLLKNVFEAIEGGIMHPEQVLLPWLEDVEGQTVYDKLAPRLSMLADNPLHKALAPAEDDC
jgi:hypothetical protein